MKHDLWQSKKTGLSAKFNLAFRSQKTAFASHFCLCDLAGWCEKDDMGVQDRPTGWWDPCKKVHMQL